MAKTVTQTHPATDERRPDFVVFTAPLMAVKHDGDDGERPVLLCTASSTAIDLEADRFTKGALEQMRDGFKGKVIFMNHSYRVPLDVFGVVEETTLVKREGRLDLDLAIRVETGNPLAMQTYGYVVGGTRLGVSVGVIVTEHDKSEDEDEFGTRIVDISGVIPLEASVVGIPCNQTAWTQEAIKSLHARGAIDFDEEEIAARPWLTTVGAAADHLTEKEDTMSKDTKTDDASEEDETDAAGAESTESDDNSSDNAGVNSDAGGDSDEGIDSGDSADDSGSDEGADNADNADESASDETADDDSGGEEEETKDQEGGGDDEHKEDDADPDKTGDFDDDVDADLAADVFIDKMYSGFFVLLRSLVPTLLNTDASVSDRRKEGDDTLTEYCAFVEKTWGETLDGLGEKSVSSGEGIDVAARLHDLAAAAESVECEVSEMKAVMAQAEEITAIAEEYVEENKQLRTAVETKDEAIELGAQIIEAVMDLPLPTITTEVEQVARTLAEKYPSLDTKVRDRIARYAPKRRNR